MQIYWNQGYIESVLKYERYQRCYYEIEISFGMCSSATGNTTNSKTNKTMILESLINSCLDFLKRIFIFGGFTSSIRNMHLSKPRQYQSFRLF